MRPARIISAIAFVFDPKQWSGPPTGRAPLAAREAESRHWPSYQPPPARATCSVVSGISPGSPHGPPPRFGAAALNATDEEKNRELVMALVGQKPGDAPCHPRTPLLAPFITCSVLLRVNNILFRRYTTPYWGVGFARRYSSINLINCGKVDVRARSCWGAAGARRSIRR